MLKLLCVLQVIVLVGCASAPAQEQSLWGRIHTLAETEQSHAPAIWVQPEGGLTAAWIGADEIGVHQDARTILGTAVGDTITLPLPPVHPNAQLLLPASDGKLHLLWQDADPELRLYAALLTPELIVERGPTMIFDQLTLRYAAVAQPNGQIVTVWSGGLPAEPTLYLQRIDERGLPRAPVLLAHDADWPTLAQANNGTLFVFWRQSSDGRLRGGQLQSDQFISDDVAIPVPALERGDRLHQLYAALDATHVYLFWNLTRAAADNQTWMISRPLDASTWNAPTLIGVGEAQEATLQTGLNTGTVNRVQAGDHLLTWAAPMPGQFEVLPVAGRMGDGLAIVYFQAGMVAGYQRIAPVDAIIGPPMLLPDRDRYLYLTWAEPLESGRAALKLTSSRG